MTVTSNLEEEYGIDFLARMACLIEGVNLACQKAEQLGLNPDKNSSWIKPLAFQKYIIDREKDMRYDIENWMIQKATSRS
jgi:hypothetical protein